jgi:hypothetical protein
MAINTAALTVTRLGMLHNCRRTRRRAAGHDAGMPLRCWRRSQTTLANPRGMMQVNSPGYVVAETQKFADEVYPRDEQTS